jgi:hypothetical protein
MANSFLEDLIGYKAVMQDGAPLPQRAAISFEGTFVSVADDPIHGVTVVTFDGDWAPSASVNFAGEEEDAGVWFIDVAGLSAAGIVRVQSTQVDETPIQITGMSLTDVPVTTRRKTLVNVGADPFTIKHQADDVDDAGFVLVDGADVVVAANGAVEVLWIAASEGLLAGWRLV